MKIKNAEQTEAKRIWTTPQLTVFGTVEKITLGCDKTDGSTDGFTYNGLDIVCSGGS